MKKIIIGLLLTSSLVALAQGAPKAVLLRIDTQEAAIVGALEGNTWATGENLSVVSQNFVKAGLKTVLLSNTGTIGKAMAGGKFAVGGCDWVRVTDYSTPVKFPYYPTYAIAADWQAVPRAITVIANNNPTYLKIVSDEITRRKLNQAPIVSQVFQTDLDNDKSNEVLIVAQNPKQTFAAQKVLNSTYGQAIGQYSLVMVRKVVAGKVQTFTLSERIVTKVFDGTEGQPQVLTQYISAIADINGDGTMEIFVDDLVHEGYGVTIYSWNGKGFSKMLEWGCGS